MAGRRPKAHLPYFSKYVDYYDDDKIIDLMMEYGPLGQTIYDVLVCEIYKNSYYLEMQIDKLAAKIIRIIGNRWVQNKQIVVQVIQYCADIGLIQKDLLSQNVITSVELQQCYAKVTVRRQFQSGEYWLLDEKGNPLLNAPINSISVYKNRINESEISNHVDNNDTKKSKVNNNIYIAVIEYFNLKCETKYQATAIETVSLITDKISKGYTLEDFKKVIDVKSKEWLGTKWQNGLKPSKLFGSDFESYLNQKELHPKQKQISTTNQGNRFNQFPQRTYTKEDYSELEKRLLNKNGGVKES